MTKKWVAFVSALLLSGTTAVAGGWAENFKTIDTDGNGRISRTEWEANVSKLKLDPAPTFMAMDADVNNGVDKDEWAAAEKMAKAFPVSCKSSKKSWCATQY
jgi:EF hand domain-containing protein